MDDLLLRIVIALALTGVGVVGYHLYTRFVLRQSHALQPSGNSTRADVPTLLYFTAPSCAVCDTTQSPTIERLVARHGEAVQVIRVDADACPDVADQWGVLSVPTIFVLDRAGQPRFFNPGLTRVETLERQLQMVSGNS